MNEAASPITPEDGDIAIGFFASLCRDRLADRLLTFSRAMPRSSIGVHELALAELLPGVAGGHTSLAIAPHDAPPGGGGTLASVRLWAQEALVALAIGHPLAAEARLTPDMLLSTVLLLSTDPAEGEMQRYLLARLFPDAQPPVDCRRGRGDDLFARVADGEGVTLVMAGRALPPGIVTRPIESPAAGFAVHAWWCGHNRSAALAALLRLLPGPVG